jgi:uncharacterized protein with gpF-like domain
MDIVLSKPFARNTQVDGYDVRQMKKALNRLGYYHPLEKTGITAIPDNAVFQALMRFQADHNLRPNGAVRPGDRTVVALNQAMAEAPDDQYIWRTVGDGHVRGAHAALDGQQRQWSDNPDPGEDFNCRCWAEPIGKQIPIPPRKPKCRNLRDSRGSLQAKLDALLQSYARLVKDLESLIEKNNKIVENMQKSLGGAIASFIIELPINRLKRVSEFLQKYFSNALSDEMLERADDLAQERAAILPIIDNKKDQLKIVSSQIKQIEKELEEIDQQLKNCE